MSSVVHFVVFAMAGAMALIHDAPWMNGWLRAGVAFFCFTSGLFPIHASGPIERLFRLSSARSLYIRFTALAVGALLIVIGLAVKNNAGGYIAAWLALTVASIYFYAQRAAAAALRAETEARGEAEHRHGTVVDRRSPS